MRLTRFSYCTLIILIGFDLGLISPLQAETLESHKAVLGRVEKVAIGKVQTVFVGKMDTGAENSSIHATEIQMFQRKGKSWVRFRVKNKQGKAIHFKKRVKRMVTIKRKGARVQNRPAIDLDLCIGTIRKRVEVNLVDRGNFKYALLIGKSFLSGHFLVDVDKEFTRDPNCGALK